MLRELQSLEHEVFELADREKWRRAEASRRRAQDPAMMLRT
jgi:hypothetical protein